jgi:hypothetical protein
VPAAKYMKIEFAHAVIKYLHSAPCRFSYL